MAQIERYGDGVIALTGCLASRLCSRIADGRLDDGARARRPADRRARPRERLLRGAAQRPRAAGPLQRGDRAARRARWAARWSAPATSTTCAARTTTTTRRCCACRPRARWPSRRSASRPTSSTSRTPTRWRARSRSGREALASTLEIAERCDVELELDRQLIPAYPVPDGETDRSYLRALVEAGPARALRRPAAGGDARADGDRARGDRPDGLQRLLPDRLGLRRLRQAQRHRRRSRAAARRPARSSPTACGSPTSTRSPTTCCSSAS